MLLDELPIASTAGLQISTDFHDIRARLSSILWQWFDLNKDMAVVSFGVLFIKKTVYLRDLESLFVKLAGPR